LAGVTPIPYADFDLLGCTIQAIFPSGKMLEVRLKARKKALEVSAFYAVYSGHPVVRK
jgi:hypothetical protein